MVGQGKGRVSLLKEGLRLYFYQHVFQKDEKTVNTYLCLVRRAAHGLFILRSHLVYTFPCPKNCMAMTIVLRTMQIMTEASNHL